eukprot:7154052-Ditylum_brightwellii.AAC.1
MLIRMGLLDPTKTPDPPPPSSKSKEKNPPENAELASASQQDVLMSRGNEYKEPEVVFADPLGIHIPRCLNVAFLTPILPFLIAYWDKTHEKVVLGCTRQKLKMFSRKRGSGGLFNAGEEGDVSGKCP